MKLKKDPIGAETLEDYLRNASDFAFELRILRMLTEKGITCEHSGQYKDPDSGKFREFDLRFRLTREMITFSAAIECKAIGSHFPLLVSTVPRKPGEAWHEIFIHEEEQPAPRAPFGLNPNLIVPRMPEGAEGFRIRESVLYPVGEPVGKSTAQVGIKASNDGEIHASDSEVFDKWAQALQSLSDLIEEIGDLEVLQRLRGEEVEVPGHIAMACPIVVVPDGRLWTVHFGEDGQRIGQIEQPDRASIFVSRHYSEGFPGSSINISHIEIMTETGLSAFVDDHLADLASMYRLLGVPDEAAAEEG